MHNGEEQDRGRWRSGAADRAAAIGQVSVGFALVTLKSEKPATQRGEDKECQKPKA